MATEMELRALEAEANRRLEVDPDDAQALSTLEQVRMQRSAMALERGEPEPG
jgi:hypothetical protein